MHNYLIKGDSDYVNHYLYFTTSLFSTIIIHLFRKFGKVSRLQYISPRKWRFTNVMIGNGILTWPLCFARPKASSNWTLEAANHIEMCSEKKQFLWPIGKIIVLLILSATKIWAISFYSLHYIINLSYMQIRPISGHLMEPSRDFSRGIHIVIVFFQIGKN